MLRFTKELFCLCVFVYVFCFSLAASKYQRQYDVLDLLAKLSMQIQLCLARCILHAIPFLR